MGSSHGTAGRFLEAIRAEGLRKMNCRPVHLSADAATARRVGARHGQPVILRIRAGEMHRQGFTFYLSANGVWLTEHVPGEYLEVVGGQWRWKTNAVSNQ